MGKPTALAIFVKTPGLTPAKTRLARTIGAEAALDFYRESLAATEELVNAWCASDPALTPYWSVAEPEGLGDPLWSRFEAISQGLGGLGERLHTVYETLLGRHSAVFFMGSDSPHLDVDRLAQAKSKLQSCDFVFGPTDDGGFYLFGGKKPIPKEIWSQVKYSAATTLEELSKGLTSLGSVEMLEPDFDVDEYESLERLAQIKPQFRKFLK